MFENHDIIITTRVLDKLRPLIYHHDNAAGELLDQELHRAHVVAPGSVPADVVTMNSEVIYEDCDTLVTRSVRIVYPKDADAGSGRVSVLAPIGSALLGMRVGQTITWRVPNGHKRIRVLEVRYQPEASGDFAL
jgi:regulator of nucleoside diphosphate kinase